MSWAKFDDLYDDNKKIKRAWRASRGAIALHAMAITYCARHELDGIVDTDWLIDKLPKDAERTKILSVLVEHNLFKVVDDEHYEINDYLEYNPSKADAEARREKDRIRKAKDGANGGRAESKRSPAGFLAESEAPDPTRPDPVVPDPLPADAAATGIHPDLQAVLAVLRSAPGLTIDDMAVNAALRSRPGLDAVAAAELVASWAHEGGLQITSSSRLLFSALDKLDKREAQKQGIRDAATAAGVPPPRRAPAGRAGADARDAELAQLQDRLKAEEDAAEAAA